MGGVAGDRDARRAGLLERAYARPQRREWRAPAPLHDRRHAIRDARVRHHDHRNVILVALGRSEPDQLGQEVDRGGRAHAAQNADHFDAATSGCASGTPVRRSPAAGAWPRRSSMRRTRSPSTRR